MKFTPIKSFILLISSFYFSASGFSQAKENSSYDVLVMLYEKTPQKVRRTKHEKEQDKKVASNENSRNVFSKYQNGKVFYFYQSDLLKILNKNTDSVFLNEKLERDKNIKYNFSNDYVIAEFLEDFPYKGIDRIWAYNSEFNLLKTPYFSEIENLFPNNAVLLDVLVRLPDKKRELNVTEDEKDRQRIIVDRDANNKDIMESFGRYTQGNVYFFYESESKCLLDSLCEMVFVNKNLQPDSSIHFKGKDSRFVIAEFTQYYDEYSKSKSADGLLFYDNNFIVMKKPFPNFVPVYYGLRQRNIAVLSWDKKLKKYYEKR